MYKKGDHVTQALPTPITGTVTGFALCQETGAVHLKVEYIDADGVTHSRHFLESELTETVKA